jgi:hypothetical protein
MLKIKMVNNCYIMIKSILSDKIFLKFIAKNAKIVKKFTT